MTFTVTVHVSSSSVEIAHTQDLGQFPTLEKATDAILGRVDLLLQSSGAGLLKTKATGVYTTDGQGKVLEPSAQRVRRHGLKSDYVRGRRSGEWVPPDRSALTADHSAVFKIRHGGVVVLGSRFTWKGR